MRKGRWLLILAIAVSVAAAAELGAGYLIWGWPTNWYARDLAKLPPGPKGDRIRYGHTLVVNTASQIGKSATDPAMRYAGNDLACSNCHLNAGLKLSPPPSSPPSPAFPCWSTIR